MSDIPAVKPGDMVRYVPDAHHWKDKTSKGEYVFAFEHSAHGPMRNGKPMYQKGDTAPPQLSGLGSLEHKDGATRDHATGIVTTAGGHAIRPTRPKAAWDATILALTPDGKATLRIYHPHGHILECPNVPFDAAGLQGGALGSWHLPEEN